MIAILEKEINKEDFSEEYKDLSDKVSFKNRVGSYRVDQSTQG